MRAIACSILALLVTAPVAAVCGGDCDGDGTVQINELVTGVGIALGQSPVTSCPAVDGNGDGAVTISELIGAANALLSGCPITTTATPLPATATSVPPSATPTATPTATANQPPSLPSPFIYRGITGQPIARAIGAVDPEGDTVTCAADALLAGMTLDPDNVLRWTPADDQVGLFDVPLSCRDGAEPPLSAIGALDFRITPPDACAPATCDPATGCTESALPLHQACCAGEEPVRVPRADVFCPEGRLLQIGANADGFGPLQSCDTFKFSRRAQTSASIRFHIRVSCLNLNSRLTIRATLESPVRGVLVSSQTSIVPATLPVAGFFTRRNLEFPFAQEGPFLNIEGTEANLTVAVRDSDGAEVSATLRVILSSQLGDDLPDP